MFSIHSLSADQISSKASEFLIDCLKRNKDKRTLLFLSGGSAVKIYRRITNCELRIKNLAIALVDERFRPGKSFNSQHLTFNKEETNAYQIEKTRLWKACRKNNIPYYSISQEGALEEAARKYNIQIEKLFKEYDYKMAVLGIGKDSHTAGLLPGYLSLWNTDKLVVGYKNDGKYAVRISLTPKALQMLDQALVVALGDKKKQAIKNALNPLNLNKLDKYPAVLLQKIKKVDLFTSMAPK